MPPSYNTFLDESLVHSLMFANKEISRKVCGPTRSESTPYLLVWVYCERCVHILYPFCIRTQYLC